MGTAQHITPETRSNVSAGPAIQRTSVTAPARVEDVEMIWLVLDARGVVRWANAAACRVLQLRPPAEITLAALVDAKDAHVVEALVGEARSGRRVEAVAQVAATTPGGEPRHLHLVLSRDDDAGPRAEPDGAIEVQGWDVTAMVARMRELEVRALRDPLTGLANRATFMDRLSHELGRSGRTGSDVAVLFADVDGFKAVNDTYGHDTGDNVLVAVSRRMTDSLRPGDTLARMGGDEFAMICPDLGGPEHAMGIADRVRLAAAEPVTVRGRRVCVTLSIGVAFATDHYLEDAAAVLLRRADEAMYDLKPRRTATSRR